MRKEWMEPVIEVQEFVANEYVAACESGMVYKFTCDAPGGPLYYYPEGDGKINWRIHWPWICRIVRSLLSPMRC